MHVVFTSDSLGPSTGIMYDIMVNSYQLARKRTLQVEATPLPINVAWRGLWDEEIALVLYPRL